MTSHDPSYEPDQESYDDIDSLAFSREEDYLTISSLYRGPSLYGVCIGEGCYWRGHGHSSHLHERRR